MCVLLVLGGARSGFAAAFIIVVIAFHRRIKWVAPVGALVTVLVFVLLRHVGTADITKTDRLLTMSDTRTYRWMDMVHTFFSNPVIGEVSGSAVNQGENSYLTVAASSGLVGVVPMMIAIVLTWRQMFQLWQSKQYLGEYAVLADVVIAGLCALGAMMMFEVMIISPLSSGFFGLVIYLTLGAFVLEVAEVRRRVAMPTQLPVAA